MGYYSGNGVVTGGSESVNPFSSISFNDVYGNTNYYFLEQLVKRSNLAKKGVSLETAQGTGATINMSEKVLWYCWWNTSGARVDKVWILPSCKGTKTEVTYSQIADSNLYELNVTTVTQKIRLKQNTGGWGGWEE